VRSVTVTVAVAVAITYPVKSRHRTSTELDVRGANAGVDNVDVHAAAVTRVAIQPVVHEPEIAYDSSLIHTIQTPAVPGVQRLPTGNVNKPILLDHGNTRIAGQGTRAGLRRFDREASNGVAKHVTYSPTSHRLENRCRNLRIFCVPEHDQVAAGNGLTGAPDAVASGADLTLRRTRESEHDKVDGSHHERRT
jgi:hypothetical protein